MYDKRIHDNQDKFYSNRLESELECLLIKLFLFMFKCKGNVFWGEIAP